MDIATEFSALVRPEMDQFLKADLHPSERVGLSGFAGLDESNHPRLVLVIIPITVPNNGAPAYTASPEISEFLHRFGTGKTEQNMGVLEFLDAKTERAKSAAAEFDSSIPRLRKRDIEVYRLIAAVDATLMWNKDDPSIGPPVDAVVIEAKSGFGGLGAKQTSRYLPIPRRVEGSTWVGSLH